MYVFLNESINGNYYIAINSRNCLMLIKNIWEKQVLLGWLVI